MLLWNCSELNVVPGTSQLVCSACFSGSLVWPFGRVLVRLRFALEAAAMGTFEVDIAAAQAIIDAQEARLLGLPVANPVTLGLVKNPARPDCRHIRVGRILECGVYVCGGGFCVYPQRRSLVHRARLPAVWAFLRRRVHQTRGRRPV